MKPDLYCKICRMRVVVHDKSYLSYQNVLPEKCGVPWLPEAAKSFEREFNFHFSLSLSFSALRGLWYPGQVGAKLPKKLSMLLSLLKQKNSFSELFYNMITYHHRKVRFSTSIQKVTGFKSLNQVKIYDYTTLIFQRSLLINFLAKGTLINPHCHFTVTSRWRTQCRQRMEGNEISAVNYTSLYCAAL